MSLTAQELFDAIGRSARFRGKVHWARSVPLTGTPLHLYFITGRRRITSAHLAATSQRSGNVEVCLMRMDGTAIVYIGGRGVAAATVFVPPADVGIERFEWVAHTHPQEMATREEGVSSGPTLADRAALEIIHDRWGQTQSTMIVCRRGRVVREVTFRIERDLRVPTGTGRLWAPSE
jgi:hypothetical protein